MVRLAEGRAAAVLHLGVKVGSIRNRGAERLQWLRDTRGQALVELALVTPVVLLMLLGIAEFGRLMNAYLTVQHAAREGARLGALGVEDTEIEQRVREAASGLAGEVSVTVTPPEAERDRGDVVQVEVRYEHEVLVPLIGTIIGPDVVLAYQSTMRVE